MPYLELPRYGYGLTASCYEMMPIITLRATLETKLERRRYTPNSKPPCQNRIRMDFSSLGLELRTCIHLGHDWSISLL